jgi:hypothetical protein
MPLTITLRILPLQSLTLCGITNMAHENRLFLMQSIFSEELL